MSLIQLFVFIALLPVILPGALFMGIACLPAYLGKLWLAQNSGDSSIKPGFIPGRYRFSASFKASASKLPCKQTIQEI